ncbi:non-specific lipid transfer protein GPI-anchored 5-like [Actinidia eriantha]|uniref:non-specific lipid transfer protein GPI-anchored 5-like n=1 Tax=Actinidia eriantha TaxID=165200 RepID=UPI0025851821|nr:non-specific lipid transfer protein GPI-anchored 5-like [Actinidia eriantha]
MTARKTEIALTMVTIAAFWIGAMSESSCTSVLISLSPCLNYITGNSSIPSSGCCTQLANVVGSQPECLCEVINDSSSLGIDINRTQALTLPNACNVETPPISRCNATSPTASPTGTPGSSSGSGSKTVPSTGGDSSDGNSTKLLFSLLVFLIFVASYASTFTTI